MGPRVHIVGAGLAGLSAALHLAKQGHAVSLYEAAGQAGGRCRSYEDVALGCRIDNGNHLVLAGNVATMAYLDLIGAADTMARPEEPRVDFIDLKTQERWALRPNRGLIPWWIFSTKRRVPGTRAMDYLGPLALAWPGMRSIATRMDMSTILARRLWHPLFLAVVNTPLEEAAAQPMWNVLLELFGRGGWSMVPCVPKQGLSESLVEPALRYLESKGARISFNRRLRALVTHERRVQALDFNEAPEAVGPKDQVILALPPQVLSALMPDVVVPDQFSPIVNAHYRVELPASARGILGVIGGEAEWIFPKPGLLSVTVSAADAMVERDREDLARALWRDVALAHGLDPKVLPPWQIVKEKRATIRANPETEARRPGPVTGIANVFLAGDWTRTGLPATIEGAIRSGVTAAKLALRHG